MIKDFRRLHADEIDVRIGQMNKNGVMLLLYKDARCDMTILDETVGPTHWQRRHTRDNANCIVSIYDPDMKEWIEKEDTGTESFSEKEKGLASDSFKRACVNWGIGRELYTSPNLFFFAKDLGDNYSYDETKKKGTCYISFTVSEIEYDAKGCITHVKITGWKYGKEVISKSFSNNITPAPTSASATVKPAAPSAPSPSAPASNQPSLIGEDEVILIGSCRGQKFGEVKNTEKFTSFMSWVKNSSTTYPDQKQNDQYKRLKQMAG